MLFADLVGSTALAGSEDPERIRGLLERFYDAMAAEIAQAGGTVEHFAGDAVMAAFGVPVALEDHAERALHAALAMQQRLQERFGGGLSMRIGVNTGEVVSGRARAGSSFVSGDVVNVAARLEQAAAPGEILVGERTATAVRGAFEVDQRMLVDAKGKPGGVPARRLIRSLSLMRPRGVGELQPAFVGRDLEFEELRTRYDEVVTSGRPQMVVLTGDAGVGKTRLVRELWAWLGGQVPPPLQRTGRCLSYGNATIYWPLGEILREHFGIGEADPPAVIRERLRDRMSLGLTLGLDAGGDLHPLVARDRLHDAWVAFLSELATRGPTVVLIEDVHWGDDELLDLLDTLVGQVDGQLLMLVTARPELLTRRAAWQGTTSRRSGVALEALPEAHADEMLRALLGSEPPATVREVVLARSEGNPFFVEELVATLIDRGVLTRRNGGWTDSETTMALTIPDTVQAVLAARIDLLPEAEKAALQAGAVIGRVFWTGPVYELLEGAMPDFSLLEERDFVRRRLGSTLVGEREYAIKHALTREVAYASVPKARRARLHARFADWLERSTDAGDERAAMLAHHYTQAAQPADADLAWAGQTDELARLQGKAGFWCRRAAQLAVSRYEIDAGLALLRSAAELEPDDARRIEIWFEIGHANALKYDGHAFTDALKRALELGASSGRVYAELAYQAVQRGAMWNPSIDPVLGEWVTEALAATEPGTLERAKALVADAREHDRPESAHEALALGRRLGDDDLCSTALFNLADVYLWTGDLQAMDYAIKQNLALAPRITDPDRLANIYVQAAGHPVVLGRFDECRRAADILKQTTAGLTPHHRVHGIGAQVGLQTDMGLWRRVCALTPEAEAVIDANAETPCVVNASALLCCALAHELTGGSRHSARLERKADDLQLRGYGFVLDPLRLDLAVARGDLERVASLIAGIEDEWLRDHWARISLLDGLRALNDLSRLEREAVDWTLPGTYIEPFALRALGVARGDPSLIRQATDRFEGMGLEWHAAETIKLSV